MLTWRLCWDHYVDALYCTAKFLQLLLFWTEMGYVGRVWNIISLNWNLCLQTCKFQNSWEKKGKGREKKKTQTRKEKKATKPKIKAMDCPENWCLMEVSTVFYICRYFVSTLWSRVINHYRILEILVLIHNLVHTYAKLVQFWLMEISIL